MWRSWVRSSFQTLIGTVKSQIVQAYYQKQAAFQTLIGTVKRGGKRRRGCGSC